MAWPRRSRSAARGDPGRAHAPQGGRRADVGRERAHAGDDRFRARGRHDVMADQYPYTATYTGIDILVPPWALAGGTRRCCDGGRSGAARDSVHAGIVWNIVNDRGGNDLRACSSRASSGTRRSRAHAERLGRAREGLRAHAGDGRAISSSRRSAAAARAPSTTCWTRRCRAHHAPPVDAIASDGRLVAPGDGHPHPRWYGTFPRVLGEYVRGARRAHARGRGAQDDVAAGRTASAGAATDRGGSARAQRADLVVFDPARCSRPRDVRGAAPVPGRGIPYVIVQRREDLVRSRRGTLVVVTHSERLAARADRVLRLTHGKLVEGARPRPFRATQSGAQADRAL
jgi:hypothetical protein